MRAACLALTTLAGCTQVLGIERLSGGDAGVTADGPRDSGPDGPPPNTIRISGTTQKETPAPQPLGEVLIEYMTLNDQVVVQTTSGPDAKFTLSVPSGGNPLEGYLRASTTDPRNAVTTQYFAAPIRADVADFVVRMADTGAIAQLASLCGADTANSGVVVVSNRDATGAAVAGATANTTPVGKYCALDGGLPKQTNVSGAQGDVFAFGLPEGRADVDVIDPRGAPLPRRTVRAHVGQLTVIPFVQ